VEQGALVMRSLTMTRRHILFALSLFAALFGTYLFYGVLQRYGFHDVIHSLQSTSPAGGANHATRALN
jgi:hypothetical protein